jgi:hypothetical protein
MLLLDGSHFEPSCIIATRVSRPCRFHAERERERDRRKRERGGEREGEKGR